MAQYRREDVFPQAGHQHDDVLHFYNLASNQEHDAHRYVPRMWAQGTGKQRWGCWGWEMQALPDMGFADSQLGGLHLSLGWLWEIEKDGGMPCPFYRPWNWVKLTGSLIVGVESGWDPDFFPLGYCMFLTAGCYQPRGLPSGRNSLRLKPLRLWAWLSALLRLALRTQKHQRLTPMTFCRIAVIQNWAKAGTFVKFQILCGLENMIPWEEVTNNDLLGILLEREDFF